MTRGSVAVVCPFSGSLPDGLEAIERLSQIVTADGDEIVLVDNTATGVVSALGDTRDGVRIVPAPRERSSYYARNVGAEATTGSWLLFVDADCVPSRDILDAYFAEPIADDCGAVAGAIVGARSQKGLVARYARARGVLDQRRLAHQERPFGATANLLVRRAAWEDVGGFLEGIRSGGDVDFCWRLQRVGWKLAYCARAEVEHVHREDLRGLVRQFVRYGAGRAWIERRYPESGRSSKHLALLAAAPALVLGNLLSRRTEHAAYRALDAAIVVGGLTGRLLENRSPRRPALAPAGADTAVVTGVFPSESAGALVRDLQAEGRSVFVVATRRPTRVPREVLRHVRVTYLEDDGAIRRLGSIGWLVAARPGAVLRLFRTARVSGRALVAIAALARRLAAADVERVYSTADDDGARAVADGAAALLDLRIEAVGARG